MNDWTVMFFFAGDNQLAPIVVSQLKGIKDAGFQENTDVLVYFDANEQGVPTKIYDVNQKRKDGLKKQQKRATKIGDGKDPFVRNMEEDLVDPEKIIIAPDRPHSIAIQKALENESEINAEQALKTFLGFCREAHPADHYILFLVGHGMVVGNDAFLPDDNPISAITLKKLGTILGQFKKEAEGTLELLALHSCSMSAIEVAFQLKGTANYLMASEGTAFLGEWPYRQLLKKGFNAVEGEVVAPDAQKKSAEQDKAESDLKVLKLISSLYFLTLHSGTDYLNAGYSYDLSLCSLDTQRFDPVTVSIQTLVRDLKKGLNESSSANGSAGTALGNRIKELVLLAHLESQSYWEESYTDLVDFCQCLRERCDPAGELGYLHVSCSDVIEKLTPIDEGDLSERFDSLVIYSNNFGWEFQYSHGLSVYFPWSRPIETVAELSRDETTGTEKYEGEKTGVKGALERYKEYAFTTELGEDSWFSFLETYLDKTERKPRFERSGAEAFKTAARTFARALSSRLDKVGGRLDKTGGRVGADCGCPSIKNYPKDREPKKVKNKVRKNLPALSLTKGALEAFE